MKRIVSIILTFAIALSLSAMALAAKIDTQAPDNKHTFDDEPVVTQLVVRFETNEDQGVLDGQKILMLDPYSKIPENLIPEVVTKDGWNHVGWVVKYEEDDGLVNFKKYIVKKSIVMVAVFSEGNELLNKVDHFAYMKGDDKGNFRPDDNMTRAEAATVFYNLLLDQNVVTGKSFNDVPDNAWYAKAVKTLATLGIINGYNDGTFKPMGTITRAEFAAMASRFDALEQGTVTFTDVPADHWAYRYIASAAAKGWVGGFPDGTFRPNDTIKRSAVAKITNGVLNRDADEAFVDSNPVRTFNDLAKSHWAYYEIMEATNGHDYERAENGVEVWTALK